MVLTGTKIASGILVFTAILTSLIGTFLLVTHGNPTSLSISPAALFWGSCFSLCCRILYDIPLNADCPLRHAARGRLEYAHWWAGPAALYAGQGTNFVVNGSLILAFSIWW